MRSAWMVTVFVFLSQSVFAKCGAIHDKALGDRMISAGKAVVELRVGEAVNIFSRSIKLVECGSEYRLSFEDEFHGYRRLWIVYFNLELTEIRVAPPE